MTHPKDAAGTADPRRFKLIPVESLTAEQCKLYDAVRSGLPEGVPLPLK